jgi:hypothetical protein
MPQPALSFPDQMSLTTAAHGLPPLPVTPLAPPRAVAAGPTRADVAASKPAEALDAACFACWVA